MAVCKKHSFLGGLLLTLAAALVFAASAAYAQEKVTGSSSQRSRADSQISGALQDLLNQQIDIYTEAQKTKAHVRTAISDCTGNNKIYWNGTTWGCTAETDPITKSYAKANLPTCTTAQVLRATSASVWSCVTPAGGAKGATPNHQWSGTSLRFENPNGTWGSYVNLKGPQGDNVVCP